MQEQGEVGESRRLISWKEIAVYLQRDVRTVRRWESREGLPVHRHIHNHKATVYAFSSELDAWSRSREPGDRPTGRSSQAHQLRWLAVALLFLLIAAGIFGWRLHRASIHPTSSDHVISSRLFVRVASESGNMRWIPTGPRPAHLALNPNSGEIYVVTSGRLQVLADGPQPAVRDLWKGALASVVVRGDGKLLAVGTLDNQVLLMTPAGRVVHTFTLANPVSGMLFSADGRDLFVAAVYNGLKRIHVPSLEILPFSSLSGRCPVSLALSPDGRRLYVDYQCGAPKGGHNEIDVLDARTGQSFGLITGFANVGNPMSLSPNGAEIWANAGDACSNPNYDHVGCPESPARVVNVIRTDDDRLVHSFAFPAQEPLGVITFVPDGSRALIGGNPLRVIDTASLSVVESYPLMAPGQAVFSADRKRLYIPALEKNAIAVVDLTSDCRRPPPGLASWWAGDGTPNDLRVANHGEIETGVRLVPGIAGQAFSFDGTGTVRVTRLMNTFTSDARLFTLAGWFRIDGKRSAASLFEITDVPTGKQLWRVELRANGSLVFCEFDEEKVCTPVGHADSNALESGRWYHFAAVHDNNGLALAVNGRTTAVAATKVHVFGERWFSATLGGDSERRVLFVGSLDELQIYNRPLSGAEVQSLYEARPFGTCYR